jgi:hypothetical protein
MRHEADTQPGGRLVRKAEPAARTRGRGREKQKSKKVKCERQRRAERQAVNSAEQFGHRGISGLR